MSVLVLSVAAALLGAKDPSRGLLDAGLACADQLNYGCALQNLEAFRAAHTAQPTVPAADALKGCSALATVYASVDRAPEAVGVFEWCLTLDPHFSLDPDVVGPRIYPHFRTARAQFLRRRLSMEPLGPPPLALHEIAPRLEPVLHTPSEVLLSGGLGIGGGDALNRLAVSAGGSLFFGEDAEAFSAGFALGVDYVRRVGPVAVLIGADFSSHGNKRDNLRAGFPSTLYTMDVFAGVDWAWLAAERLELVVGAAAGLSFAGLGNLNDRLGGRVSLRAGLMVRVSDEFAAGFLAEPGLVLMTLDSGALGTSVVLPLLARFEARF